MAPDTPTYNEYAMADEVAQQVMALCEDYRRQDIHPQQVFAGVLLGLIGFLQCAPGEGPFDLAELAINALRDVQAHHRERGGRPAPITRGKRHLWRPAEA